MVPKPIKAAFHKCGIWPFNPEVFTATDFAPSTGTSTQHPDPCTYPIHQPSSPISATDTEDKDWTLYLLGSKGSEADDEPNVKEQQPESNEPNAPANPTLSQSPMPTLTSPHPTRTHPIIDTDNGGLNSSSTSHGIACIVHCPDSVAISFSSQLSPTLPPPPHSIPLQAVAMPLRLRPRLQKHVEQLEHVVNAERTLCEYAEVQYVATKAHCTLHAHENK